jgi:hypothetical protein
MKVKFLGIFLETERFKTGKDYMCFFIFHLGNGWEKSFRLAGNFRLYLRGVRERSGGGHPLSCGLRRFRFLKVWFGLLSGDAVH